MARRMFAPPPVVYKELKDSPDSLCVGDSGGGTHGMAVLEGLVAALEVSAVVSVVA